MSKVRELCKVYWVRLKEDMWEPAKNDSSNPVSIALFNNCILRMTVIEPMTKMPWKEQAVFSWKHLD